jgi:hypothetical protein
MLTSLSKLFGVSSDVLLAGLSSYHDGGVEEQHLSGANHMHPVLSAAWEKMTPKQRRKLVQIAVLLAED